MQLEMAFALFDVNGDGQLSVSELTDKLVHTGQKLTNEEVRPAPTTTADRWPPPLAGSSSCTRTRDAERLQIVCCSYFDRPVHASRVPEVGVGVAHMFGQYVHLGGRAACGWRYRRGRLSLTRRVQRHEVLDRSYGAVVNRYLTESSLSTRG